MKPQTLALLFGVYCVFSPFAYCAEESVVAASGQEPLPPFTYEHQEIAQPNISMSKDATTKESIREQVRAMRRERADTMPYLDRGYIREAIDSERVTKGVSFASGEQKNLQQLIDRAIEVNTPTKAAVERTSLAQRRLFIAIRELFPEASFEYQDREGILSTGDFNARAYTFELRQPIFRGGTLWNTMLQERAEVKASQKEYDRLLGDMVRDVSEAYFEYNRTLQVSEDQLDVLERMKRYAAISQQKFKEELISEIEHLNTESLYSQLKYDYETAKQELELSRLEMQSFLDLLNDQEIAVAPLYNVESLLAEGRQSDDPSIFLEADGGEIDKAQGLPPLPDLVELAYKNRPELQVESARLTAARLRERAQWGELLPHADIVLEGGGLGESLDIIDVHPKLRKEYQLSLEFTWNMWGNTVEYNYENDQNAPSVTQFQSSGGEGTETRTNTFKVNLLDGLDALAQIKEAEAEKLEQISELEEAEKEVIQELKQAFFEYQKALIQVKSALKRLDYRERLVELSKHRLGQNEVEVSEYIQAEIDLMSEKLELHKALKDYFTAKASLNRAVGIANFLPIEEFYGAR